VEARVVVERVLGRVIQEDEEVSIMAFSPHPAPASAERQALVRGLEKRVNQTADRARDVADEEVEATIDEALNYVRSHPQ
jgi:hypothetical protein